MTYDEIKASLDAQADEHNQWDVLSEDENAEMRTFKVGDKVWNDILGEGVVCSISGDKIYSVSVKFNECTHIKRYTIDGKWCKYDKEPEIFLKDVE